MGWLSLKRITGSEGANLGGAVQSVINTVSDAGSALDDFVNNEIPGGWATVISIAAPPLAPVATGVQVLAKGGDLEDALKAAALTYGVQQVGGKISSVESSTVTPEMIQAANATSDPIASLASQAGWINVDPAYLTEISAAAATPDIFTDTVAPDTSFNVDYSLSSAQTAPASLEGFQATLEPTPLPIPDVPVDYSLAIKEQMSGLKPFVLPSLSEMGGGQGLVLPVEGGFMTSQGLIPYDTVMSIGNPESFINGGTLNESALQTRLQDEIQGRLLSKAIQSLFGVAGAMAARPSPPPVEPTPAFVPESSLPQYTPEYYAALQQSYNQIAPQQVQGNVVEPLQSWFVPQETIDQRLFGGQL